MVVDTHVVRLGGAARAGVRTRRSRRVGGRRGCVVLCTLPGVMVGDRGLTSSLCRPMAIEGIPFGAELLGNLGAFQDGRTNDCRDCLRCWRAHRTRVWSSVTKGSCVHMYLQLVDDGGVDGMGPGVVSRRGGPTLERVTLEGALIFLSWIEARDARRCPPAHPLRRRGACGTSCCRGCWPASA